MDFIIIFLLIILLLIAAAAVFFLQKRLSLLVELKTEVEKKDSWQFIQQEIQNLSRNFDDKLARTEKNLNDTKDTIHQSLERQFSQSARIITEVTEKLTRLDETNKQVVSFTDQIGRLEKVLTHTKQRGNLGEAGLALILENMLPPGTFAFQHRFKNGETVDAVIFVKDQILPIDAKFSLDNYRRVIEETDPEKRKELEKDFKNDLKKRIDETAKYIRKEEGTFDFAFMYIPAEGIYYDLLINEVGALKVNTRNLIDYAFAEKHVIIVSPTTFTAYLHTVIQGLRALEIEESAKEVRERVEQLGKHLLSLDSYFQKLGKNLDTTVNSYNQAYKELAKADKDVLKITGGEKQITPELIEKPTRFDSTAENQIN